jgi:hypothetical protein
VRFAHDSWGGKSKTLKFVFPDSILPSSLPSISFDLLRSPSIRIPFALRQSIESICGFGQRSEAESWSWSWLVTNEVTAEQEAEKAKKRTTTAEAADSQDSDFCFILNILLCPNFGFFLISINLKIK